MVKNTLNVGRIEEGFECSTISRQDEAWIFINTSI